MLFPLVCLAFTSGCASTAVFAERQGNRSRASVLRIATERGIKDVSNAEFRRLEVPIEVRPDSIAVTIPGSCAVRRFRHEDLDARGFALDSIREDTTNITITAGAAGQDPGGRGAGLAVVTVPPGEPRVVTITVSVSRDSLGADELGLRLDSSPDALRASGDCSMISRIGQTDSTYVEHYLLPGIVTESAGLAITAAVLLIAAIAIVTGR